MIGVVTEDIVVVTTEDRLTLLKGMLDQEMEVHPLADYLLWTPHAWMCIFWASSTLVSIYLLSRITHVIATLI